MSRSESGATGGPVPSRSPRGAIPRVEHQQAHGDFLRAVRPPAAMISVTHAERLLDDGKTAADWFPEETDVITTTTIADADLADLDWERERNLVEEFDPSYHVPTDYPTYSSMDAADRVENARRCARGTLYMADELEDVTVLPLVKGTTPAERAVCERVVRELDPPLAVFYGTQYFTVPGARQFYGLRDVLESVHAETGGHPLLVIGFMGTSDGVDGRNMTLSGLPDSVRAAAGLRTWLTRVEPREHDPEEMRRAYAALDEDVADCLGLAPPYRYPSDARPTPGEED